jgi:hypothetical protein
MKRQTVRKHIPAVNYYVDGKLAGNLMDPKDEKKINRAIHKMAKRARSGHEQHTFATCPHPFLCCYPKE